MIGPEATGRALAIAFDDHPRKLWRFARVVAVFYDVLQSETVRLVFEFALMPVHDRSDANFRHEKACVADEGARGNSSDDESDPLASGFFDFAAMVHLQNMGNFMTENKRELGFVVEGAKQAGIDEQGAVGHRRCINRRIFHNEEAELQSARGAVYS